MAILMGFIAGILNYLTSRFLNIEIIFCTIMIGIFIPIKIKDAYYNYHILYSILSVLFAYLALAIAYVTKIVFFSYDLMEFGIFSWNLFKTGLLELYYRIKMLFVMSDGFIDNLLDLIIIITTLFLSYKMSKKD